jgi:hypothetical protein
VTHNDEQIDLLMRRFAGSAAAAPGSQDHLDADEMNAFAEGALPPAARARYVSHLAGCDQCRKQVTELAIASGALARTEQSVANKPERLGFWATLSSAFALPALRYAAFAAMVVIVASVGFVALRHRSEPSGFALRTEPMAENKRTELKPSVDDKNSALDDKPDTTRPSAAATPAGTPAATLDSAPATRADQPAKSDDRVAENTTPPSGLMKEATKSGEESEKKTEQVPVTQSQAYQAQPSYAPVPPAEVQQSAQQSAGRGQTQSGFFGGGVKTQPTQAADKAAAADRERDMAKDNQLGVNEPSTRRVADEKMKGGPSRNVDNTTANNRNTNEVRAEAPKSPSGADATEQSPQIKSIGGHKFRRQGNSWVDQKFKSSMPLRTVSRGSENFAALDGGVRSIAQQISGEVIIVWKGKAFLIK